MFELINKNDVENLKHIFLSVQLDCDIDIKIDNIKLHVTRVSENSTDNDWGDEEFYLLNGNDDEPLIINNRHYNISIKIGWWGKNYRIRNAHISLGSNCSKLGVFFAQLELSQAVKDDKYIYFIKKLSKLGGYGAIARLNSGLKTKTEKIARRYELINKLNAETITCDGEEWIVVTKISKNHLQKQENDSGIFGKFLKNFLCYSFTIEEIINNTK